jgi:hypothetical protein
MMVPRTRRDPATIYEDFVGSSDFRAVVNVPAFRTSFEYYYDKPVQFVEDIIQPDDPVQLWQADFLEAIRDNKKCACASCQGAGKTAAVAWAIIWFAATRPKSKVICTAPGRHLLEGVLWAELYKWITHSNKLSQIFEWTATKIVHKGRDDFGKPYAPNWFIMARTTTAHYGTDGEVKQAEGLAGFHADHLLFIIDEASGIGPEHFRTAEGTLTGYENKIVVIGNPLRTDGRFYEIFNDDNVSKQWTLFNVSALPNGTYTGPDGPEKLDHVTYVSQIADRKDARDSIRELGLNHFEVQARKLGRFPEKHSTDTGFTVSEIAEAQRRKYDNQAGRRSADRCRLRPLRRRRDGHHRSARVEDHAHDHPREERGHRDHRTHRDDALGGGARDAAAARHPTGPADRGADQAGREADHRGHRRGRRGRRRRRLRHDVGHRLRQHRRRPLRRERHRVRPLRQPRRRNVARASLKDMMKSLDLSETIEGDNGKRVADMKLRRQLTTRRYKYTGKGQQKVLESKDEMRRRKLPSPDRADALCLACVIPPSPGVY